MELLKVVLSEEDWRKTFDYEFDNDKPGAFKFDGAGEHVTTVFDVYTLDVLSRIIDVEESDGFFTFEKLVKEFGGYPEYFKRETVLLAKRVYRYLKENYPEKVESFPNEDKPGELDWLQIILKNVTAITTQEENTGPLNLVKWKVREELKNVLFKVKSIRRLGWDKTTNLHVYLEAVIAFLQEKQYTSDELKKAQEFKDLVNAKLKKVNVDGEFEESTFAPVIPYHTSKGAVQTGNDKFGPNYFWKDEEEKYRLTGKVDCEETEYDVCKKKLPEELTAEEKKLLKSFLKEEYRETNEVIKNKKDSSGDFPRLRKNRMRNTHKDNPRTEAIYFEYQLSEVDSYTIGFGYLPYFYERKDVNLLCEPKRVKMAVFAYEDTSNLKNLIEKCYEKGIKIDGKDVVFLKKRELEKSENRRWDPVDYLEVPSWVVEKYKYENNGRIVYTEVIKKMLNAIFEVNEKMKNEIIELLEENKQVILTGAPGTGKTYLARQIAADMIGTTLEGLENNDHFKFVQFHPSYDYTDFVEGLRPEKHDGNNIGFKRQDGIFKEFCKKANEKENEKNADGTVKKFVFVIDEINRGDISKIFGELFYAIDPGYRGVKGKVNTQYQNLLKDVNDDLYKDGFYVPENVYIIGTMNDIDRSVESMDFAIRRRFIWCAIEPTKTQESILADAAYKEEIKNLMEAVNLAIVHTDGLGEAFQLGASYFYVKSKGNDTESDWNTYKGKIWKYRVRPLLKEYLRGLPNEPGALKELENSWDDPDKTINKYKDGNANTNQLIGDND